MQSRTKKRRRGVRPGPGRPNLLHKPIRRLISFEEHQYDLVWEIAQIRGVSVSQVIRDLIDGLDTEAA